MTILLEKLKSRVNYFLFFHQIITYEKCFLFHLKRFFHSENIQFSVFLSSFIFSWSDIALEDDRR